MQLTGSQITSQLLIKSQLPRSARNVVKIQALFLFKKPAAAPSAVDKVLSIIDATNRGMTTKAYQLQQIKQAFQELEEGQKTPCPDPSGTWKLLWTTEQETLFILKNAGFFGTKAGDVYQVIDTPAGSLQNVIEFPPEGAFIVDSGIEWEQGQSRVNFKFNGAALKLPSRKINLPPVGKGWFDNVYQNGKYRFSKDIRGDYLVCVKEGPPRKFE